MSSCSFLDAFPRQSWWLTYDRLTSTKHQRTVECSAHLCDHTSAAQDSKKGTLAPFPEKRTTARSLKTNPSVSEQEIDTGHFPALSRHKSIRKHLGRFLLYFSRAHPTSSHNTYDYRYGGDASELPAEETPIEGSATVQEMPASFSNRGAVELEQPHPFDSEHHMNTMGSSYDGRSYSAHQSHCKSKHTDNLPMFRGSLQVTTPQQLPRLALPGSLHDLPAMTTDRSPLSASSISPNTPVGQFNNDAQPHWSYEPTPHLVSPCDAPSASQWYDEAWSPNTKHSFDSPIARSSTRSSNATTPMSAHPSSTCTSFGVWPQPGPEYLKSAFPQRYQNPYYESNTTIAPRYNPNMWMPESNSPANQYQGPALQIQDHPQAVTLNTFLSSRQSCNPPNCNIHRTVAEPLCSEVQLLPAIHIHDTTAHNCPGSHEAPPAYSPVNLNPLQYLPATCRQCGKSFTGKYGSGNLKRHIRQVHESLMGGAIHVCEICMKTYNRADALRKHSWKKHRQETARPNKRRKL